MTGVHGVGGALGILLLGVDPQASVLKPVQIP